MEIKEAKFIKGIRGTDKILEEEKQQIAFYGRSNVGKSSSINALLGRKQLVKSSSKPGKTKELNFFEINSDFYIVDLPGYGYAKVSEKEREKLRKLIAWYIFDGKVKNRINILVLDGKVGLTSMDKEILETFKSLKEDYIILMNKTDKLKQKDLNKKYKILLSKIDDSKKIIKFSAIKKTGIDKFWEKVF